MAELSEAFNGIKFDIKNFQSIDYFFTQRNLKEDHEFLDQNMNRKKKQVNIVYNFLAISVPHYDLTSETNSTIELEFFGDTGYHYKGYINNLIGASPNFMIPLKGDKKLFVHLIYKGAENPNKEQSTKEYICFIEVPKRFQTVDTSNNNLKNEVDTDLEVTL